MTENTKKTSKALVPVSDAPCFIVPKLDAGIDPEVAALISDEDFAAYEQTDQALPIVEIRQKEVKNEKGRVVTDAGGFKMYDPVSGDNQPVDIPADKGLYVTIMADQGSRVLFDSDNNVSCRSMDNKVGVGNPGGACHQCVWNRFSFDNRASGRDERKWCKQQDNLLVMDHQSGFPYVFRLAPSGLSIYKRFKQACLRDRVLPMAVVTHIEVEYKTDPKPHYVPKFTIVGKVPVDVYMEIKSVRDSAGTRLDATAGVDTDIDDMEDTSTVGDHGGDLPEGVEPVDQGHQKLDKHGKTGNEDLPF
jgi:hypothetical protein